VLSKKDESGRIRSRTVMRSEDQARLCKTDGAGDGEKFSNSA
jgi:hypothetical protein